jgi:hypothetical protein
LRFRPGGRIFDLAAVAPQYITGQFADNLDQAHGKEVYHEKRQEIEIGTGRSFYMLLTEHLSENIIDISK